MTRAADSGTDRAMGSTPAPRTLAGGAASLLSGLALRLPERLLITQADLVGEVWSRVTPRRAALASANLRRVCLALAQDGRAASPRIRRAATDDRALRALVRSAYRHAARYYLEVARAPAFDRAYLEQRLEVENPEVVDAALAPGSAPIVVGLHFGALEVPAVFVAHRLGRVVTVPMEEVPDPGLQAWFVRSRSRVGVRIVTLGAARRELATALARAEPVGLVADRDITGGGIEVPFFGHPAPMPVGPALLAVESAAPVFVGGVRRVGPGRYRGRLVPVETPADGPRRERVTELVRRLAAAFEAIIADAPEQWWACFQPVWPDITGPPT